MNEENNEKSIWERDYSSLSLEEKAQMWSASLHRSMRDYMEQDLSQYDLFNKKWYKEMLDEEKDFDAIMDIVFEKWWTGYNKNEYLRRIGKL